MRQSSDSIAAVPAHTVHSVPRALVLGAVIALGLVMALSTRADGPGQGLAWRMIGHDVRNTRSQPFEGRIGPQNAARLAPKWVLTTAGDVSATPAVSSADDEDAADRSDHGRAVYFPDWGGMLWKVDAETGAVLWARAISDYTGVAGSLSHTSPVLAYGLVYVADLNGHLMAVDAATGDLRWLTRLDPHPAAIITASPIVLDDRLYLGVSSNETTFAQQTPGYPCCTFRGSLLALDAHTGRIVWQTFVLPDNGGQPGGFAGGAFVNPPAIDRGHGLVYGGAGQLYTQPDAVTACLAATPGGWSEACFPSGAYFNAVVAFDLRTGQPRWAFRGAGADAWQQACGPLPSSVTRCPPATLFSVWDFAGAGANVFRTHLQGRERTVVGIGQKSGVYWTLEADTGQLLWSTLVGPGADPGGIQWGTAYDGQRIYAAIGPSPDEPYRLPSGD